MYESVFILSGQITQKSANEKIKSFLEKITSSGGKVLKEESWGLRTLAYKIKKNSKGYYFLVNSECKIEVLNNFDKMIKLDEQFLRFLNIKVKTFDKEPSYLDENRSGGTER